MSIKNILFDLKHYEDDTKIKKIIKILNFKCKADDKFDSGESYNFNRALARETSHITDHLTRIMDNNNTKKCQQINICCGNLNKAIPLLNYGNLIEFDVIFDYEYFILEDIQKQEYIYLLLYNSLENICRQVKWDFLPFSDSLNIIKQKNFINNFLTGKKIKNSDGIFAQLYCWNRQCKVQKRTKHWWEFGKTAIKVVK